jgi:hypothetical protein
MHPGGRFRALAICLAGGMLKLGARLQGCLEGRATLGRASRPRALPAGVQVGLEVPVQGIPYHDIAAAQRSAQVLGGRCKL